MERLVTVMCWLFNSEQHLDRNILKLKEEKHQAVEAEGTFERKKEVRYEVVLGEWGIETFMKNSLHPPTLAKIHLQGGTVRRNRKDSKVTWTVYEILQMGPRPGMTVKCVEQWG
jgi:hypothetical protein